MTFAMIVLLVAAATVVVLTILSVSVIARADQSKVAAKAVVMSCAVVDDTEIIENAVRRNHSIGN